MQKGQVYKIHSDFYYVKVNSDIIECKLREVLKKQKIEVYIGDYVVIEEGCVISKVLERKNYIKRPSVANLDLLVVISAIKEPLLDLIQLNRYLIFAKLNNIETILCFNKEDLSKDKFFKSQIEEIYKPLGYKILITSAKEKTGLNEFKKQIKDKLVALCGQSGVGKSSLLNAINENLDLRTGEVNKKHKRGTHTTRHLEIIEFEDYKIADTPGFSNLKFDFVMPQELGDAFDEIKKYKEGCKFKNCLHTAQSVECNVIKNLDNINISRYESYLEFALEALEYKEKITKQGTKKEAAHKQTHSKNAVKITARKRQSARNTQKQRIKYD